MNATRPARGPGPLTIQADIARRAREILIASSEPAAIAGAVDTKGREIHDKYDHLNWVSEVVLKDPVAQAELIREEFLVWSKSAVPKELVDPELQMAVRRLLLTELTEQSRQDVRTQLVEAGALALIRGDSQAIESVNRAAFAFEAATRLVPEHNAALRQIPTYRRQKDAALIDGPTSERLGQISDALTLLLNGDSRRADRLGLEDVQRTRAVLEAQTRPTGSPRVEGFDPARIDSLEVEPVRTIGFMSRFGFTATLIDQDGHRLILEMTRPSFGAPEPVVPKVICADVRPLESGEAQLVLKGLVATARPTTPPARLGQERLTAMLQDFVAGRAINLQRSS